MRGMTMGQLTEIFQPGSAYQAFAARARRDYRPWDKIRRMAAAEGLDAQIAWFVIDQERRSGAQATGLVDAEGQPFWFSLPAELSRELMLNDQGLAGNIGQISPKRVGRRLTDRFITNATMEEAIASSLLEGAATTRSEAKAMLKEGREPRNAGEREVLNNYRAMRFVKDHLDEDLTPALLFEVHRLLLEGTPDADWGGRLRLTGERVDVVDERDQEVVHRPPPADALPGRLRHLCAFANIRPGSDPDRFMHPLLRAMAVHFQLGYEHPFHEGNGRTARALFYWHVLRNGFWIFEFLPLSMRFRKATSQYTHAYLHTERDGNDLGYFFEFHLRMIGQAREDFGAYLSDQQRRQEEAVQTFRGDARVTPRQARLLDELIRKNLEISIKAHQTQARISYPTARDDLLKLHAWGYLHERRDGRRKMYRPTGEARGHG